MMAEVLNFPGSSKRRLVVSRLKDARLAMQLNQSELAAAIGVTRQSISAYEQGEKAPEPATMSKIAETLQQPLSFFVNEDLPVFGNNSSIFLRAVGPSTKRRNMACEVFGKWFTQITAYVDTFINFPVVRVPQLAPATSDDRYTADEIETAADECRKTWQLGVGPIADMISLLEGNGVTVCRCGVESDDVEAFSFWNGERPFVVLSSEKQSAVRSRFDAAHELGHLILHRWIDTAQIEDPKVHKQIEREADRFASAFLLPSKSFRAEVFTTRLDAFVSLKRRWKVSIQAMVMRCKQLGLFDEDQVTNLYKQISARRWRTREPLDDVAEMPLEQPRLLRRALEMVVSAGKKMVDEILAEVRIAARLVAEICNLPNDFFRRPPAVDFSPSLR